MAEAFGWGVLAASSLVIGAIVAIVFRIPVRWNALIMAFGAGALISAVAFDLVEEAVDQAPHDEWAFAGLFVGCAVFFFGDVLIARSGGSRRKASAVATGDDSALAIVLGTVLDGIPESIVIGLTIQQAGSVGVAYLAAVIVSNVPEALSSTTGLVARGWTRTRIMSMWAAIAAISGVASLAGYGLFEGSSPDTIAFVLCFAAGAILTMLADTMMPEAYEHGGELTGVVTTLGFAAAFMLHTLD